MTERYALDWRDKSGTGHHDCDKARGVSLQRQVGEVEQQSRSTDNVSRIGNIFRRFYVHLRLGFLGPALILDQPLLQLTDAGQILIELLTIVAAKTRSQVIGLIAHIIEDASAIFQAIQLG